VFLIVALWIVRILMRAARSEALRVDGAFPAGKQWRDWAREALEAARGGDHRSALHAAYWAGVYRLADLGAWQIDRTRTPREYLRLLRKRPSAIAGASFDSEGTQFPVRVDTLAALTRSMEASWYGSSPATERDFEAAIENLEELGCKLRSIRPTASS